jgi:murein DD-endopeptidase MepM/ murein hydrolase activator NlpD
MLAAIHRTVNRFFVPAIVLISLFACATGQSLQPDWEYGKPVDYGEKKHPGLDYDLAVGTPIIACADGIVTLVKPYHR